MLENKSDIIENIVELLLDDKKEEAQDVIKRSYPYSSYKVNKRVYTLAQKMEQFLKDGFIDRYTGKRLLNPGILKVLSHYFPDEFPYDPHWKMTSTHIAYWELTPTIDHIVPIAVGGEDISDNWATTSMKNNSIKSNYTLGEINWKLLPRGSIRIWDGLTELFLKIVEKDKSLLQDAYIKNWYNTSKKMFKNPSAKDIFNFALKWYNKFDDENTSYRELVCNEMANDCDLLGFEMDCGHAFSKVYPKAGSDVTELELIVDKIVDVSLLGSAIYSQWRYFNHWAYLPDEILEEENRKWFLVALNRLMQLAN